MEHPPARHAPVPSIAALSLDGAVLYNSPRGRYHGVLLAPPLLSPGRGTPSVCRPVGMQSSTLLHHWINFWVKGPLVCILWHPTVSVLSIARRNDWGDVPQHPVGRPEKQDGAPAHSLHSRGRETMALTRFSGGSLNFWRAWWFPNLPCVVPSLACCAEAVQLSLTRDCSIYHCTLDVSWEWGAWCPPSLPPWIHPSLLCVESITIAEWLYGMNEWLIEMSTEKDNALENLSWPWAIGH